MEGNILDTTSKSGVYKCTACDTLSVHITGYAKEPCSECGSNSHWLVKNMTTKNKTANKTMYKHRYR